MSFFKKISFVSVALILLSACTDYVAEIDEQIEELEAIIKYSSGGSIKSSSSLNQFNPDIKYGELTDPRDGQIYKTVTIGSQTWMAQNLNFKTDSSFCYNNEDSNCIKYGRLYRWAAAVGKSERECGYGKMCSLLSGNIQGVCPDGWHLPSYTEWETLFNAVGGISTAGKVLKSMSAWSSGGNGSDAFGFSALPAGYRSSNGGYDNDGSYAYFWSSTGYLSDDAYNMYLDYYSVNANLNRDYKGNGFSVRCLQDEASGQSAKSSSSEKIGSSSSNNSSNQFNPDVEYGELLDSRDGLTYKTVKIGSQTWMAQNLNYETDDSYCPDGKEKNCSTYGRLYKWNAAKTVCPASWHLPSKDEFVTLLAKVGGGFMAGTELKALAGWNNKGNGLDSYGFSAIPAGYKSSDGQYAGVGYRAHFWSSTEDRDGYAYYMYVVYNDTAGYVSGNYYGKNELSVRCLKVDSSSVRSSSSVKSSSSSEAPISSSSEKKESSSSSSRLNQFNPDIEYGMLLDSRDSLTYKTVTIGSQTWMAENLNFKTDSSFCYGNDESNCITYGRLYIWTVATSACPSGWHLPSSDEWNTLLTAVGGASTAGAVLKAASGWYGNGNGSDDFGFSALPAGDRYNNGIYNGESNSAFFWSSTDHDGVGAYYMSLIYYGNADLSRKGKDYGFSVRCLKGEASEQTAESSSSETTMSSSSVAETTSSGKESWAYLNPAISYGEMTDDRDGQVYKTVVIGEQEWMAENLNYELDSSFCYENDINNCEKYGRLYVWSIAKTVCPSNWHLPNNDEWKSLIISVGDSAVAGTKLKSTSGWCNNGNGTNDYGFAAFPVGTRSSKGVYSSDGCVAYFWSSISTVEGFAFSMNLLFNKNGYSYLQGYTSNNALSVRCLKGNPNSNVESSSSESAESSSSKESWAYLNSAISYGEITDSRDGQIYKTVVIGKQNWMAENLNFETDSSFCYSNEESNCAKYGRLYRWAAAVGESEDKCGYGLTCSLPSGNIQGACPNGWHVPSKDEWNTLFTAIGDTSIAGKVLKSTSGWSSGGNGTDDFGFSVLPAGIRLKDGSYGDEGSYAHFWNSTEGADLVAYYVIMGLYYGDGYVANKYNDKYYGFSVRCVKDD